MQQTWVVGTLDGPVNPPQALEQFEANRSAAKSESQLPAAAIATQRERDRQLTRQEEKILQPAPAQRKPPQREQSMHSSSSAPPSRRA
jgi:hypothetical protein